MELKYKSWNDITINIYERLQQNIKDAEITGDAEMDALNQNIAMISVLCDVDEDVIADLGLVEFSKLVAQTDFLKEMPETEINSKYTINGKVYEVFTDIQNMTMNQYIDFQKLYKDKNNKTRELLACFLIPEGKKYCDGYNVAEVIKDIGEHFSIVDANSILFFFAILYQSLIKTTLNYSIKQMKKAMRKIKDREQKNKMMIEIMRLKTLIHSL